MTRRNNLPTISVVTATRNSMRTIEQCLQSIRSQEYPKEKIEIIVADGGSTDGTIEVAKKYGARIYPVDPSKQNAEYNKSVGVSKASHEVIAMIDHDNVLPHRGWLKRMVRPFMEKSHVVGVETLRYQYEPKGAILDRYFALFGGGDPLVWYLGKTDRLSYMFDSYNLSGTIIQRKPYYIVRFSEKNMPTIGANGFLVRRQILKKYADIVPGRYFDMDVNIDLIRRGFDTFAFVDDGIIHKTGYGSIWYYLKRRALFMNQYHVGRSSEHRRFHMVSKHNAWRLVFATLAIVTLVLPFIDSIRGWRKVRDNAWFLHPFLALGFVCIYVWVIMRHYISSYGRALDK